MTYQIPRKPEYLWDEIKRLTASRNFLAKQANILRSIYLDIDLVMAESLHHHFTDADHQTFTTARVAARDLRVRLCTQVDELDAAIMDLQDELHMADRLAN